MRVRVSLQVPTMRRNLMDKEISYTVIGYSSNKDTTVNWFDDQVQAELYMAHLLDHEGYDRVMIDEITTIITRKTITEINKEGKNNE